MRKIIFFIILAQWFTIFSNQCDAFLGIPSPKQIAINIKITFWAQILKTLMFVYNHTIKSKHAHGAAIGFLTTVFLEHIIKEIIRNKQDQQNKQNLHINHLDLIIKEIIRNKQDQQIKQNLPINHIAMLQQRYRPIKPPASEKNYSSFICTLLACIYGANISTTEIKAWKDLELNSLIAGIFLGIAHVVWNEIEENFFECREKQGLLQNSKNGIKQSFFCAISVPISFYTTQKLKRLTYQTP